MQLGMIGLGRMGGNMTRRLQRKGQRVVVYDTDAERARALAVETGALAANDLAGVLAALSSPRVAWVMVPAGEPTQLTLNALAERMEPGDILIDGGNADYRDTVRRAAVLAQEGISLVDVGTSGGVWGAELGYCLMIGGPEEAVRQCEPVFRALAPEDGFAHVGRSGAGHFVKMVHNGIEYGLLQAYAEGFELLHASEFELDLTRIAGLWNHGSVVRSWLLELVERAFEAEGAALERVRGWVGDSGEGRWAVRTAIELDVPAPVITLSLLARLASRQESSYAARVIAALRAQFGGHAFQAAEPPEARDTGE